MNTIALNSVEEITTLHGEIVSAAISSLSKASRIGELLTQERERLKHGEWLPWIKANLPFTDRTARNYIRVYENRDRLKMESVSDLTGAYRLLTERTEIIDLNNLPDARLLAEDISEEGQRRHDALYEAVRAHCEEQILRLKDMTDLIEVVILVREAERLECYFKELVLCSRNAETRTRIELARMLDGTGLTVDKALKFTEADWHRWHQRISKAAA